MEKTAGNSRFTMSEGDWICSDTSCGNINFARRSSCNRCHKEKSEVPSKKKVSNEIGKAAAEKSRGLFSADDWECSKCGNVNWARRQTCNMCNAPRYETEERTGLGGGYNDRGVVEYIERTSDDEYDEFGRKKKKKSESVTSGRSTNSGRNDSDEEEEEDEEDDDDDADLSKYDLSGFDDVPEGANGNAEKNKDFEQRQARTKTRGRSRSRSHSRSRSRSH